MPPGGLLSMACSAGSLASCASSCVQALRAASASPLAYTAAAAAAVAEAKLGGVPRGAVLEVVLGAVGWGEAAPLALPGLLLGLLEVVEGRELGV